MTEKGLFKEDLARHFADLSETNSYSLETIFGHQ